MSTAPLETAIAALRSFVHQSGALRAQAVLPAVDGEQPALVSCTRMGPLEIVAGGRSAVLAHDVDLADAGPDLGALRPLPPFDVSAEQGEVTGVIGGLDQVAEALRVIASALGPAAAVVVELETTTPAVPLVLSARAGEPLLVTLGEEEFEL